jgi:hypothetical protein
VRGHMHLNRDPLLDSSQQVKGHTERVTDPVQRPVLVVGFKRQAAKPFCLLSGIGVTNGLVDPAAADFNGSKRLAGELSALFLWHRQDLIGNLGVEPLQPRKLLCLDLIEAKERQLEGLGERCHDWYYLARLCKIKMRWGGAPSAPAIHPATQVAGFLAEFL